MSSIEHALQSNGIPPYPHRPGPHRAYKRASWLLMKWVRVDRAPARATWKP